MYAAATACTHLLLQLRHRGAEVATECVSAMRCPHSVVLLLGTLGEASGSSAGTLATQQAR
jgi:hypothetical protein